jgi:hypothetical protein
MKLKTVLVLITSIVLVSCESPGHRQLRADRRHGPEVGMAKEEITRLYGGPNQITATDTGEVWHYNNIGRAFIPFNFGWRLQTKQFLFDKEGRLKTYSVDK